MLILLSDNILDKSLINPGLSSLLIYKLYLDNSASILIPLTFTILGLPPNNVPETDLVCFSVSIVSVILDWYSLAFSCLIVVICIDLVLATATELIMFTPSKFFFNKKQIIVWINGWVLIFETAPPKWIFVDFIEFLQDS